MRTQLVEYKADSKNKKARVELHMFFKLCHIIIIHIRKFSTHLTASFTASTVRLRHLHFNLIKKNYMALVRERTIPTERPPPVGEVSAKFCG